MSQAAIGHTRWAIAEGYPLPPAVARDLQRVRAALQDVRRDIAESVQPLVEGGTLGGGKLLRPTFLLLAGRTCGAITEDHIRVATALELIHSAGPSLVLGAAPAWRTRSSMISWTSLAIAPSCAKPWGRICSERN